IAEIVVTPASPALDVFEQVALSAEAMDGTSNTLLIASDFQWTSDNGAVASVDSSGQVTAHAPGTAVITATEPESGASGQASVTVALASVSLSRIGRVGEPGYSHIGEIFDMDLGPDGSVHLLNRTSKVINVSSLNGEPLRRIALPAGWFYSGVAVGSDGLVYAITSSPTRAVFGLDADGNVINQIVPTSDPDSEFGVPVGIAFDASGRLHIVDRNDFVVIFETDGTFVGKYGARGFGLGEFQDPAGLCLGPDDKMYVGDRQLSEVQRFTEEGVPEAEWDAVGGLVDVTATSSRVLVLEPDGVRAYSADGAIAGGSTAGADTYRYIAVNDRADLAIFTAGRQVLISNGSSLGPILQWGIGPESPGHFAEPTGAVVDEQGRSFVVDASRNVLSRFGPGGALEVEVAATDARFQSPNGVAIADDGSLWVGVVEGVRRYSPDLEFIEELDLGTTMLDPRDLQLGPDGNFYVADGLGGRVRVYSSTGAAGTSIGTAELFRPTDIAFDPAGLLYVADEAGVIMRYDLDGRLLGQWGTEGEADGQFRMPSGIAVDYRGLVYVADRDNRRVQVFTGDGTFVAAMPFADDYGSLLAVDVEVSPDGGRLVVCAPEDVLVYALTN
ncbi:MAG: hypothetical protein GF320_20430, partial [Armatimonadia bacterium]|nr:hypothetical protein [Armatimonadia bacterium]